MPLLASLIPCLLIAGGLYVAMTGNVVASFLPFRILDFLACVAALLLLALAKRFSDGGRPSLSAMALVSFGFLMSLAMANELVLLTRFDTTGVAVYSATLQNWHNTFVRLNSDGFWERDFESAATARSGDWLIAVVGDSFTYGFGVKGKEQRFSDRIESGLRAIPGHGRATVLNMGWPGANTVDERQVVEKFAAKIKPDVVLICYLANDIREAKVMRRQAVPTTAFERALSRIPSLGFVYTKTFGTYRYQVDGMSYMANLAIAYQDPEGLERHLDEVRGLLGSAQGIGARAVFVLLPFPHLWAMVEPEVRQRVYASLRSAAESTGALVIDLTSIEKEMTPFEFQLNSSDSHPNERVHGTMAERILKELVPFLSQTPRGVPVR